MKSHQRSSIGNSTIEEYMLRDYNVPDSFEHFLYVSQLLQAEGISLGMEAQRRNRDICMGSLYWQLNDCWPVASWSSIDYYGKWKALHYQTKKSFEESILSFHKNNNEIAIYFVTDKLHSEKYKYNFQLRDFSGKIYNSWKGEFHSNPNNSKIIHNIDLASISIDNEYFNDKFIFAYVTLNDIIISERIKYLTPLKNLKLTQPKFQYEVNTVDSFYEIKLISKNLIKNLFIASMLEYNFSDNYFDLIPNKEKVIRINRDNFSSARSFEESLRFISLYDTY
jgi:beta-mannosidase